MKFSWKFPRKLGGRGGLWFTIYTLVIVVLTAWIGYAYRCDLMNMDIEEVSSVIRNFGMVAGGFIAIGLATWRSLVAKRQADIAELSLVYDRFQRAVEGLDSEKSYVRLGMIQVLGQLGAEHPIELAHDVIHTLNSHAGLTLRRVKHPPDTSWEGEERGLEVLVSCKMVEQVYKIYLDRRLVTKQSYKDMMDSSADIQRRAQRVFPTSVLGSS